MNKPETIEQALEVVERITTAGSRIEAEYGLFFARGWLGALLMEERVDKETHDRLLDEAMANVEKSRAKA